MASSISPTSMLAIGSAIPALSIVAVCARFYVRFSHKQGLGADDWLVMILESASLNFSQVDHTSAGKLLPHDALWIEVSLTLSTS